MDPLSFTSGGSTYDLVILEHIAEDTAQVHRNWIGTRPLLLYTCPSQNKRELILWNDSLVKCQGCGGIFGDPYASITFEQDTLKLFHYGGSTWRWEEIHAFVRGANGDWPLVLRTYSSYSVFEPDSTREITSVIPGAGDRLATSTSTWWPVHGCRRYVTGSIICRSMNSSTTQHRKALGMG